MSNAITLYVEFTWNELKSQGIDRFFQEIGLASVSSYRDALDELSNDKPRFNQLFGYFLSYAKIIANNLFKTPDCLSYLEENGVGPEDLYDIVFEYDNDILNITYYFVNSTTSHENCSYENIDTYDEGSVVVCKTNKYPKFVLKSTNRIVEFEKFDNLLDFLRYLSKNSSTQIYIFIFDKSWYVIVGRKTNMPIFSVSKASNFSGTIVEDIFYDIIPRRGKHYYSGSLKSFIEITNVY